MTARVNLTSSLPKAYHQIRELRTMVEAAAVDAGLDPKLVELVKIRASQLNGCAFCLDLHTKDARALGESERRLHLLAAWRETELFDERERAALALTEAMTTLSETRDVPDEVYAAATAVFTDEQYVAIAWSAAVINTFNRLAVTSRKALP